MYPAPRKYMPHLELYAQMNEYRRDQKNRFVACTKAATTCSPQSDMARWLGFEGLGCFVLRLGQVVYGFGTFAEMRGVYDGNPLSPSIYCQMPKLLDVHQPAPLGIS